MDKYTKGILTVIAVGIIGLNIQLMNGGGIFSKAYAAGNNCGSSMANACYVYSTGGEVMVSGTVMTMSLD